MKSKLKKTTKAGKGGEDPYERILDVLIVISIILVRPRMCNKYY